MEEEGTRRVSPEKAVKLLQEKGLNVSLKAATQILEYLYKVANIAVAQYLKK